MIKEIKTRTLELYGKRNWIDQNNVVFGFQDETQCCEAWGWNVFNEETREKVRGNPDGLPYHFDIEHGAKTESCSGEVELQENDAILKIDEMSHYGDVTDVVQVRLVADDGKGPNLIFQCYTLHNGWYLHSFDFEKKPMMGRRPRLFIIRGLPGSGKTTLAKSYPCLHLEGDMFAIRGGVYHWNDNDSSGLTALANLDVMVGFSMEKRCDIVVSSVLPYFSPDKGDTRGHTIFNLLSMAEENDYEIWMVTLYENHGNVHGCPEEVYRDIFLDEDSLIKQVKEFFGEDFANRIHREKMPTGFVVNNEEQ